MDAYVAQLIFQIKCSENSVEQYEEQWRLVIADSYRDALSEAKNIGSKEESTFVDRHGRTIQWKLIAIKNIERTDFKNGELLFSNVKEVAPVTEPVWEAV